MKAKILILSLFFSLSSFGQKLPITGLCLSDVVGAVGGTCLSEAFTNANPTYFDPAYAVSGDCLADFRNYGAAVPPDYPIYYISNKSDIALTANPAQSTYTIPSDATFLVVCIKAVLGFYRQGSAPNWNGTNLTQAGSYYGSNLSEIWYLSNPASGTYTLSIPNSGGTNIHVLSAWYKSVGNISLHSTGSALGNSTNVSASVQIPINYNLLITDAVTYELQTGTSLNRTSNTDFSLYFGVIGAVFGSSTQYKIYKPTSGTEYSLGWVISESRPWSSVVACFKSN